MAGKGRVPQAARASKTGMSGRLEPSQAPPQERPWTPKDFRPPQLNQALSAAERNYIIRIMDLLWRTSFAWWHFVLRGTAVYFAILILLRLGGKRQIGQMGAGEFVAILLISNAVQNAMNGGDNSITGGLVLAATLIVLSALVAYANYKSKRWEALTQGRPRLLVHQGNILHANLGKELLNLHELKTMLRRQGIHNLSEISEAVLESNGSLSVIKKSDTANTMVPGT
jgi:uncharacterized membrane protein YcaP (DUF421 family)